MLRFAPKLDSDLTLSNLRVAILNYLVAKQNDDRFILRFADIDSDKIIEGKDSEIIQIFEKFAIKDDLRYHQQERQSIHQKLALGLLESNKAYICVCDDSTKECQCQNLDKKSLQEIKESKKPFVIKLNSDEFKDIVILDNNAKPTYNFAMACDDMLDDIDTIITTKDQTKEYLIQQVIKKLLGFQKETTTYFIPSIDTKISLEYLLKEGFIPDAIINYLLLLGYKDAKSDIFTLPEAIKWYDIAKIDDDNQFNINRLKDINRQHLINVDDKELSRVFGFADSDIGKLAKLYLNECSTIDELDKKIKPIFKPKDFDNDYADEMKIAQDVIFNAPMIDSYGELKEYILANSTLNADNLDVVLSLLMTNQKNDLTNLDKIYDCIKTYILEVIS
jgi:glutamyl-tRNA synthetase